MKILKYSEKLKNEAKRIIDKSALYIMWNNEVKA